MRRNLNDFLLKSSQKWHIKYTWAVGGKSASGKMAKQSALDFVKRTLNRCHEFHTTGKSCFSEPFLKEIFHSGLSRLNHSEVDDVIDGQSRKADGISMENFTGAQLSSMLNNHDMHLSERTVGKDNICSSRSKKRELYLDDVATSMTCTSSEMPSGVGRVIINSVKGKRSERDHRNVGLKVGRPAKTKFKTETKKQLNYLRLLIAPLVNFQSNQGQNCLLFQSLASLKRMSVC